MATWGYICVKNEEQEAEFEANRILPSLSSKEHLVIEVYSGTDFNRPKYQALKDKMSEHDVLIVPECDRLAEDDEEVKKELEDLKNRKIRLMISIGIETIFDDEKMKKYMNTEEER